jgi:hypothetical protein
MLRALHSKTQTLEHTDYYKKVLDEEKKEIIKASARAAPLAHQVVFRKAHVEQNPLGGSRYLSVCCRERQHVTLTVMSSLTPLVS